VRAERVSVLPRQFAFTLENEGMHFVVRFCLGPLWCAWNSEPRGVHGREDLGSRRCQDLQPYLKQSVARLDLRAKTQEAYSE
jgi:hypothetical protein